MDGSLPLDQFSPPINGRPRVSVNATYAGSSCVSLPSALVSQLPSTARPLEARPVLSA